MGHSNAILEIDIQREIHQFSVVGSTASVSVEDRYTTLLFNLREEARYSKLRREYVNIWKTKDIGVLLEAQETIPLPEPIQIIV